MEMMYAQWLISAEQDDGDDEQVMQHRDYALRAYMFYLDGTSIFVDTGTYYFDMVYLRYFTDLKRIHEYN